MSTLAVGLLGIALFLGSYGAAKLTGHWATYAAPSTQKTVNPANAIYGWMTFAQVAETVKLPAEKVLEIASLPADTPLDVSMKKIEGVDDHAVQEALTVWFTAQTTAPTGSEKVLPPDEIRGSMTGVEVAKMYNLDVKAIFKKAGWPEESSGEKQLKDVAKELGSDVSAIRDAVKALLQTP